MKELIDRWRDQPPHADVSDHVALSNCADELEAWQRDLWTKVEAGKPETYPPLNQTVAYCDHDPDPWIESMLFEEPQMRFEWIKDGTLVYWRPLIPGVDTPLCDHEWGTRKGGFVEHCGKCGQINPVGYNIDTPEDV